MTMLTNSKALALTSTAFVTVPCIVLLKIEDVLENINVQL